MRATRNQEASEGSVVGIVLAGGRSERFGRDKLAEEYQGRPLLHHPVSALLEVCDRVIVVIAPDAEEPPMPAGAAVAFARDDVEDEGPLRGLAAGLQVANAEWIVLAGGDMPELQPVVLLEMLRAGVETGVAAVSLADHGQERPLPCVLRRAPASEAVATLLQAGRRSLRDLLAAVTGNVIDEPTWTALDPERRTLTDVDEPGDIAR
jgi:molybdopterin-guanine dinucleotide biosynthesis protein A